MNSTADYVKEWSLAQVDREYYAEKAEQQVRVKQIKSKVAGTPNWWHAIPISPTTTEVTEKITKKAYFEHEICHCTNKKSVVNEFEQNCEIANKLKRTQASDCQMYAD